MAYGKGTVGAVISDDISVEMELDMKLITIRNGAGDYVTLTDREFADLIGVVGSHAWAYGITEGSKDASDAE